MGIISERNSISDSKKTVNYSVARPKGGATIDLSLKLPAARAIRLISSIIALPLNQSLLKGIVVK